MKTALVCGAGGFIGSHLVKRLKADGYWVRGADLKLPDFSETEADDFALGDLCNFRNAERAMSLPNGEVFDEVYQLAADMGGAGYIFTGENDAGIMHNSAQINLNIGSIAVGKKVGKLFYSSSACMYPAYNQEDPDNPKCSEDSAYPAAPDSEYGWENLQLAEGTLQALEHVSAGDMRKAITLLQSAASLFGSELTGDRIREVAGVIPDEKIEELLQLCVAGDSQKSQALAEDILKDGFPCLQILEQFGYYLADSDLLEDEMKAEICLKLGEVEKKLVDGADEWLQLSHCISIATIVCSTKPEK